MFRFALVSVIALTACTKPAGPPQGQWPPPADVSEALPAEVTPTIRESRTVEVAPADAPSPVTP